jgi:hypothetical protein
MNKVTVALQEQQAQALVVEAEHRHLHWGKQALLQHQ